MYLNVYVISSKKKSVVRAIQKLCSAPFPQEEADFNKKGLAQNKLLLPHNIQYLVPNPLLLPLY
jgi:hypothetical protein